MFVAVIDGECVVVEEVQEHGYLPMLILEDKREFYIASSQEEAGEKAREYWEQLAQDDPGEFAAIVGEKTLVAWALGQYAGPGSTQVTGLEEWLDLWLDTPEEQWAGYDSAERDIQVNRNLALELGWPEPLEDGQLDTRKMQGVCYRWN